MSLQLSLGVQVIVTTKDVEAWRKERDEVFMEIQRLQARHILLSRKLEAAAVLLPDFEPPSPTEPSTAAPPAQPPRAPDEQAGLSISEMILTVLRDAYAHGEPGLEPKEIARRIEKRWAAKLQPNAASATSWRLWKRGDLAKRASRYRIAQKNEAGDLTPERQSPASEPQPLQAREAEPGGGT